MKVFEIIIYNNLPYRAGQDRVVKLEPQKIKKTIFLVSNHSQESWGQSNKKN